MRLMRTMKSIRELMFVPQFVNMAGSVAAFAAIILAAIVVMSPRGQTLSDEGGFDPAKVEQGLDIAPVPLTYQQHNRNLVGYGS
jgi:hypothetical protein